MCWAESTVVGTSTATCLLSSTASKAARMATSVFPKPTSPHTSRSIGPPCAGIRPSTRAGLFLPPALRHVGDHLLDGARLVRRGLEGELGLELSVDCPAP